MSITFKGPADATREPRRPRSVCGALVGVPRLGHMTYVDEATSPDPPFQIQDNGFPTSNGDSV